MLLLGDTCIDVSCGLSLDPKIPPVKVYFFFGSYFSYFFGNVKSIDVSCGLSLDPKIPPVKIYFFFGSYFSYFFGNVKSIDFPKVKLSNLF